MCKLALTLTLTLVACATRAPLPALQRAQRLPASETPSLLRGHIVLQKMSLGGFDELQRVGAFLESPTAPRFRGCILYLQGLGDSIQNHEPLFNTLNASGYRVIAFDYLGQGESDGEMAQTRINAYGDPYPKRIDYEIGQQAKRAWAKFEEFKDPIFQRSCQGSKKLLLGWSTGGLAAFKLAHEKWADAYVLVAPGLKPNFCVGEAAGGGFYKCLKTNRKSDEIITLRTLTSATYEDGESNPHLDPIRPSTPIEAKEFVINLMSTAYINVPFWRIPQSTKGLVFLSGREDTYVDREATRTLLKRNAPSFTVVTFEGALHEIDNERPEISKAMHQRTVEFFNQQTP